jgi:hypothetical protein
MMKQSVDVDEDDSNVEHQSLSMKQDDFQGKEKHSTSNGDADFDEDEFVAETSRCTIVCLKPAQLKCFFCLFCRLFHYPTTTTMFLPCSGVTIHLRMKYKDGRSPTLIEF